MTKLVAHCLTLCLTGTLIGCTSCPPTKTVPEYETVEVVRDRYVAISDDLTQPAPRVYIPRGTPVSTNLLNAVCQANVEQLKLCNAQLKSISQIEGTLVPEEPHD